MTDHERRNARVLAIVHSFNEQLVGQSRADAITALWTLCAHWIHHMRHPRSTESDAVFMVISGILGSLQHIKKEGITPGERPPPREEVRPS